MGVNLNRFTTILLRLCATLPTAGMTGCGGGGDSNGPGSGGPTISKATPDGDRQSGRAGTILPAPLRVVVSEGGQPVAGKTVSWQIESGGGSANPASAATDASGIASTTITLSGSAGEMRITASATDTRGGPLPFTALVAGSSATVRVTNNTFQPQIAAVTEGGTVTFEWTAGSLQHNLIPDGGKDRPNDPAVRDAPFTLQVMFPAAGVYEYHCSVHGSAGSGMYGTIVVIP